MKTKLPKNRNSEIRAEQVTNATKRGRAKRGPVYEAIYVGADLHKASITVTRIIDQAAPQPPRQLDWAAFWPWVKQQSELARKVHLVYEAGAFGFWPARQLRQMGVEALVAHPIRLDGRHQKVQTDGLDSQQLADNLQRYVRGNDKALTPVYVPTEAEEQQRLEGRHRRHLHEQCQGLKARGRGLLLSQGIFANEGWWQAERWTELEPQLSAPLRAALADDRALIGQYEAKLKAVEQQLIDAAPKRLPLGLGALTFMLLIRELCNYQRFGDRRKIGGFTGLCGGVSSSGSYYAELSITKAGSAYLRTLLIELAWRMVYYQPGYTGLRVWKRFCGEDRQAPKRRRKVAIVALARQLAVDLWRWQCGMVSPKQLGWIMRQA